MDNRSSQKPQKAFQKANRFCSTFLSWHPSKSGIGIGKKTFSRSKIQACSSCFTKHNPYLTPKSIPQFSIEVFFIFWKSHIFWFYGWIVSWNLSEKHVSNQTFWKKNGYITSMLPSKVMPYLLRLAAPLMDSSIVQNFYNSR